MTFQNAATTVAAFILYFVRKVLEKAGGKILIKNIQVVSGSKAGKKKKRQEQILSFSHGGDKRDRTAELLNAIGFEVLDSMKFVRKLRQNSTI